jgi:cyclopropane fatty-acyl-phospholipid synthase-like methyltransferase
MWKPFKRLAFNTSYLFRPRWDTGIPAPEITRFINGEEPGNAIDIGCGTGTNLLYLAQHKWKVTGIDFAPLAIKAAHRKLKQFPATLLAADATRLCDLDLPGPFDLALDMGCFHSLTDNDRGDYVRGLEKWMKRYGVYMVYSFQPSTNDSRGIFKEDMIEYFKNGFDLINYEQGQGRPSAWYYFERK